MGHDSYPSRFNFSLSDHCAAGGASVVATALRQATGDAVEALPRAATATCTEMLGIFRRAGRSLGLRRMRW